MLAMLVIWLVWWLWWFVTDLFVVVWGLFCCLFWFAVLVSCLFDLLVICDGWLLIVGV